MFRSSVLCIQQREHRTHHIRQTLFGVGNVVVVEDYHDRIEFRCVIQHGSKARNKTRMS